MLFVEVGLDLFVIDGLGVVPVETGVDDLFNALALDRRGSCLHCLVADPDRVLGDGAGHQSRTNGVHLGLAGVGADPVREGIRVNAVNLGTADTPWIGRLMDAAEEVAGAVAYLASPLSGSTNGVALAVDGGMQGLRLRPI